MSHSQGIAAPNYTQVPNIIFDELMPLMKNAELRCVLVVVRQTLGWHVKRTKKPLPASEVAKRAGISLRSAQTGLEEGRKRGILKRYPKKDDDGRDTFAYGLNFKVEHARLYQVSERKKAKKSTPTYAKFARVFRIPATPPAYAKFARVPTQILHRWLSGITGEAPMQNLRSSYKEERNISTKEKKKKKESDQNKVIAPPPSVQKSSSQSASPDKKTEASSVSPATEVGEAAPALEALLNQTETADTSQALPENPTQHSDRHEPNQATRLEKVPPASETVHKEAEHPQPTDPVAEVNRILDADLTGRWLKPYVLRGENKPPLISELGRTGLERFRIAQTLNVAQVRDVQAKARAEAAPRADEPKPPAYATLLLRGLEERVLELDRLQAEMSAPVAPETAANLSVGPSAAKSLAARWKVGDKVLYCAEAYEVTEITERHITVALLEDPDITSSILISTMHVHTLRPCRPATQQTG